MLFEIALILLSYVIYSLQKNRWFYILYRTLRRDLKAGVRFLRLNTKLWKFEKYNKTVPKVFTALARKHPEKAALYYEDEVWTFRQMDDFSNRIAHFFKSEGFARGDSIALLLESRPEYACIWLGLAKIGVVTALINSNLVSDPLVHSIKVSNAKGIIYGRSFTNVIRNISKRIEDLKLYQFNENSENGVLAEGATNLREELKDQSVVTPQQDIDKGRPRDKLIFIYTSGTTGLPKAAVITHLRYAFMALGLHHMTCLRKSDILYDPLPLYHSAGGVVGVGQCLLEGIPIVIRKKFSASNFWKDCVKYNCTAAQYIGEICRYILAAHAKDSSAVQHSVRLLVGNGLRPQIWTEFSEKFHIKEIYEFYGATEGNSNLINIDNTVGAVGFVPRYAGFVYPVTLVKCDEETGEPIRNKAGFCDRCDPGDPGVFINLINPKKSFSDFAGYADKMATQKKVIVNVFKKGDIYFNSGDILVQDELGNYYFRDRTGDTFRWKGENVATSEVEAVISNVISLNDAVVYGVEVPGAEGRAGMVAIVDSDNSVDLNQLCKGVRAHLPSYSVPIFVRIMRALPMTGTFKLKKMDLQNEGFDLNKVTDKLYFYDTKAGSYVELTRGIYDDIMNGKIRL